MANQPAGKAPSDSPALKPYRGKPAARNFREGNGNVGIIRSPVRAIALPDMTLNAPTKPIPSIADQSTVPTYFSSARQSIQYTRAAKSGRMVKELDLFESNHGCWLNTLSQGKHPKRT